MNEMVDEALSILCSTRCICNFGELLHEAWMLKRNLSPQVSNSVVDDLYELAQKNGAIGGKITGAGGGGFLLLFVSPSVQERMRKVFRELIYVPFKFENSGSQIIFHEPSKEDYSSLDRERAFNSVRPFREANEL
jgi:D-glycero-alpha-D-manno-heptose-7-phosphate kinase